MGTITRVAFFTSHNEETLATLVNQFAESIEHSGDAIKHISYQYDVDSPAGGWTAMVVYGKGPTISRMWGSHE